MKNILITGANGQLGNAFTKINPTAAEKFTFAERSDLDITDLASIKAYLKQQESNIVVNCAAYTKVDAAETDEENAMLVNHTGAKNLAIACQEMGTLLIHISTDFVFDGTKGTPYKTSDATSPIGVYGGSKLLGEQAVIKHNPRSIIIRTAWVYAEHGHNFVKTMLRLGAERNSLGVVYDQVGSPTYAPDLANAIMQIIRHPKTASITHPEIYHYANEGVISWFDFAKNIMQIAQLSCAINPIETHQYPTPAKRPAYSVLSSQKIKTDFDIAIPYWRDSLAKCIGHLA